MQWRQSTVGLSGLLSNLSVLLALNINHEHLHPAPSPVNRNRLTPPSHSAYFSTFSFPSHHIPHQHLSPSLPHSDALRRREEGGSSVHRSSHHLWNFRARPRWKGVLCPPDEECPCVVPQRKGFIWPGIWRHLEKCTGYFLGGGVGWVYGKLKAFIRLDRRRTGLSQSWC